MEKVLTPLLEAAKKDKKVLLKLKHLAVETREFELASQLRDLEKKLFPKTKEQETAKEFGKSLGTLFRMVGINDVSPSTAWVVYTTLESFRKKKGKFSIKDASKITDQREKLFE